MELAVKPGKYVVAVSGGVDSMVLLDVLARQKNMELVVAHYDHGIRQDSAEDRLLVQSAASKYGLHFEYEEGFLGETASEERARNARYAFLYAVCKAFNADCILTAHHQDDLLETALLNMLRGTGRKGITSLASGPQLLRPLLYVPKAQILAYAAQHRIQWREDSTNSDTKYARNYIRSTLMPRLSSSQKDELLAIIANMQLKNTEIDQEIAKILQLNNVNNRVSRHVIIMMPHTVACESVAAWLRINNIRSFDKNIIERLVVAIKTYRPGQRADIMQGNYMAVSDNYVEIKSGAKR